MAAVKIGTRLLAGLKITRDFVSRNNGDTNALDDLITKADEANAPKPTELNLTVVDAVGIMQKWLGGRVVTNASPAVYIRATNVLKGSKIDHAQFTALVKWVSRQNWLRGDKTLLDVLNLAPRYLATAIKEQEAATAPPARSFSEDD